MSDLLRSARDAIVRSAELARRAERAIDQAHRSVGEQRARRTAQERIDALEREVSGLRRAIDGRAAIEQAKGILIATTGCSPDEAFKLLVRQSQHQNRKLRAVAEDLVASKARSAQSA